MKSSFWTGILLLFFPAVPSSLAQSIQKKTETIMPATETNKAVIRSLHNDCLNQRNWSLLDTLIAHDYSAANGAKGPEGFKEPLIALITTFPDLRWHVETLVAENDKVTVHWTWLAHQTGPYDGLPPTGKAVSSEAIAIYTLREGKVVSVKLLINRLAFLQQLNMLPSDEELRNQLKGEKGKVYFIDRFVIPKPARALFMKQAQYNRSLIQTIDGFMGDKCYESRDENGNVLLMTIATWRDETALNQAKEQVRKTYAEQGFDAAGFLRKHHITMERNTFTTPIE